MNLTIQETSSLTKYIRDCDELGPSQHRDASTVRFLMWSVGRGISRQDIISWPLSPSGLATLNSLREMAAVKQDGLDLATVILALWGYTSLCIDLHESESATAEHKKVIWSLLGSSCTAPLTALNQFLGGSNEALAGFVKDISRPLDSAVANYLGRSSAFFRLCPSMPECGEEDPRIIQYLRLRISEARPCHFEAFSTVMDAVTEKD